MSLQGGEHVIGLTGGIGTGKSVVSRLLRTEGMMVYDCDLEAKRLMAGNQELHDAFTARWGAEIYVDGELDRAAVARRVFADEEELQWLNSQVHGRVRKHLQGWIESHAGKGPLFVESAILCSSGLDSLCDRIWVVEAPEELRIARLAARSGLTAEEAKSRMRAQSQEEMQCKASGLAVAQIHNDGMTSLLDRVRELLQDL